MATMRPDTGDTIVAVSSALGSAPAAVVRLSGPAAIDSAAELFAPDSGAGLRETPGARRREGRIRLGAACVPASALVFRRPRSYTGEDLVELHVPGSPAVCGRLIERLAAAPSVRPAGPGEFTARAFLNGKLDLSRAEGVAAIIHSADESQRRAARRLIEGSLFRAAAALRRRLIDLLAELEAGIDFVEEDIEFIPRRRVCAEIAGIAADLDARLRPGRAGESPDGRLRVVLVGRPNVGKSTLLNALSGEDRAIAAPVAGTTRDPVSTRVAFGGLELTVIDSAGIDGAGVPAGIDAAAQAEALRRRDEADLAVLVIDATAGAAEADRAIVGPLGAERVLTVANKCDLCGDRIAGADAHVSALTGAGLEGLRAAIADRLGSRPVESGEGDVGLNARHRQATAAAREALARASAAAAGPAPAADLIAFELREAAWHVGSIAGQVAADDVFDRIFARFCVGK